MFHFAVPQCIDFNQYLHNDSTVDEIGIPNQFSEYTVHVWQFEKPSNTTQHNTNLRKFATLTYMYMYMYIVH